MSVKARRAQVVQTSHLPDTLASPVVRAPTSLRKRGHRGRPEVAAAKPLMAGCKRRPKTRNVCGWRARFVENDSRLRGNKAFPTFCPFSARWTRNSRRRTGSCWLSAFPLGGDSFDLGSSLTLRRLVRRLTVLDLAALGGVGFREWALLDPLADAAIESPAAAPPTPGCGHSLLRRRRCGPDATALRDLQELAAECERFKFALEAATDLAEPQDWTPSGA